ncbi:hypothetical protein L873DRAFT_1681120, partial [Choiromyces venosus 120613-1]
LNLQLYLVLEVESDYKYYILLIMNEVAIILPIEYSDIGFHDIVLSKRIAYGESGFLFINANYVEYIILQYVLLYP